MNNDSAAGMLPPAPVDQAATNWSAPDTLSARSPDGYSIAVQRLGDDQLLLSLINDAKRVFSASIQIDIAMAEELIAALAAQIVIVRTGHAN